MSKEDYSFMKSGFDLTGATVADSDFKENATALLVTYTSEALRTAALYVSHGVRKVVTIEDIKRAMMLELFLFNKRPDLLEKTKEIKDEIYGDDGEEDGEEDGEGDGEGDGVGGVDEDLNEVIASDEEMVPFTENSCTCAMCSGINTIYTRWEDWTPTSEFEKMFMKHIEQMG